LLHLVKEQIKANAAELTAFESWRFDRPPLSMNGGFDRARAVFGGEAELKRVLNEMNRAVFADASTGERRDEVRSPGKTAT
jgi:type I restriction enzyme, R subunit